MIIMSSIANNNKENIVPDILKFINEFCGKHVLKRFGIFKYADTHRPDGEQLTLFSSFTITSNDDEENELGVAGTPTGVAAGITAETTVVADDDTEVTSASTVLLIEGPSAPAVPLLGGPSAPAIPLLEGPSVPAIPLLEGPSAPAVPLIEDAHAVVALADASNTMGIPAIGNTKCAVKDNNPANWYPAEALFVDKILIGFSNESFYQILQHNGDDSYGIQVGYGKDVWYGFDRLHANWEGLQLYVGAEIVKSIQESTETHGKHGCLCFDDSLIRRGLGVHGRKNNARVTEFLANCFDHNDRKMYPGFRMMTGVWTNGEESVPLTQALLGSRDEKNQFGPVDTGDGRTWEGKRRRRALTKGTQVMVDMTREIIKAGVQFDYVLADTWFSRPVQLIDIKNTGKDMIAMAQRRGNVKYGILPSGSVKNGEELTADDLQWGTAAEIYSLSKKRPGVSKYLLTVDAWVKDKSGELYPVKLVYNRNRNNRKEWIVLVTTDMTLSPVEVIRTYALRWSIEVYFKICKSYLGLNDCHSTSYDALTCRMVITAIRHMFLVVQRFRNNDKRSIEQIFAQAKREVADYFIDHLVLVAFDTIFEGVEVILKPTKKQMKELILYVLDRLPEHFRSLFDRKKVEKIA